MGSLQEKASGQTIGGNKPARVEPWNSDVFAPEPLKPSPLSVDRPKTAAPPPKKDKRRKSSSNKWADEQLGVLEGEGY